MFKNRTKFSNRYKWPNGFSLAEVVAVLLIGAMIMVTVLAIYSRAQQCSAAITRNVAKSRLPREVLQRIAEDLDKIVATGRNVRIATNNKFESHGFQSGRLEITKTIYNKTNKAETFEKIIWQSSYDFENEGGLVLYRSHSGINMEDKLLDENKDDWERELFVPVCTGVTYFSIEIPGDGNMKDRWRSDRLPRGIAVTISFSEPIRTPAGTWEIPDEEKITRIIAIDRTRKLKFKFVPKDTEEQEDEDVTEEPNDVEPNDVDVIEQTTGLGL